jgi:Raf kinase inhibitor-like YbhB/YbcL family protein
MLALMASTISCDGVERSPREEIVVDTPEVITVRSPAFQHEQPIPSRYTCDGDDQPPPLAWDGVPADAAAVALIVDDPDAPRGTFVHWVLLDMPTATTQLDTDALPASAVQAKNSAGRASYFGPCPPSGTHHYRFTIYALSQPTGLRDGAELDEALRAVESTATANGRLVGTYARSG